MNAPRVLIIEDQGMFRSFLCVLAPKPSTVSAPRPEGSGQRSPGKGGAPAVRAKGSAAARAPGSSRVMGAVIALLAVGLLLAALDVFGVVDVRGLASRLLGR